MTPDKAASAGTTHDTEGFVSSGLYELSAQLGKRNPDAQSYGLLGGEWGYGQDFANDVFEMHPFWWGDCTCGQEKRAAKLDDEHPDLSDDEWIEWERANPHDPRCRYEMPNFRHFASGYTVEWYKYIGRSEKANRPISYTEFVQIITECLASIGATFDGEDSEVFP